MNRQSDLIGPVAGGVVFAVVGIVFDQLFSSDPSYIRGILGGLAFAVAWYVALRLRQRSNGGTDVEDG